MDTSGLDELFAEVAVRERILTPPQLEDCRKALETASQIGLHVSLYQVAIEKGFMTKHEVLNLVTPLIKGGGRPRLGSFEVISKIGAGRMGTIYRAEQTSLRRVVALRVLPVRFTSDEEVVRAFQNEARRASTLIHRNAVALIDIGESAGLHFMATQFVEGESLADLIKKERRLPEKRAVNITTAMADVLESAHARGILHADIKPTNILIAKDGNPVLCDFGLPKQMMLLKGAGAAPDGDLGSAHFMSPELGRSAPDIDGRSDIYSLGALLFFMLTGEPPFHGTLEEIKAAREQGPPWPQSIAPGLSKSVCAIIQKSMAAHPDRRYKTASELLFALRNHARSLPGAMLARMARAMQLQTPVEPQPVTLPGVSSADLPRLPDQSTALAEETAIGIEPPPPPQPVLAAVSVRPAAEAPVPEHVAKRRKRRRILNLAVLGACLVVVIGLTAAAIMYYGGRGEEKPAPEVAKQEPAAREAIPTPPVDILEKSTANLQDAEAAKRLLEDTYKYAYVNPSEGEEIIKRFEAVIRIAPKSEHAADAKRRIDEIKGKMVKEELGAIDQAISEAEGLAAADKYSEAVKKLEQSMKDAKPEQKTRLTAGINDLKNRAKLRFQEIRAKASDLAKRGNYDEARKTLESAKAMGVSSVLALIDEETKTLDEARDTAQVSAIEKTAEAYHQAMLPVLRLAAERAYDEALAECEKIAERADLQEVRAKIAADRDGLKTTCDIYTSVSTSGDELVGKRITISGISGKIASIKDGIVSLQTGYKKPLSSLKLVEILSLYSRGAKTFTADEYLKRGVFLMYNGDLEGAGPEFEAARAKGANADTLLEKLRQLEMWRRNDAVEELLAAVREANTQGDSKKALETLEQIKKDYGDTDAYARRQYDMEDLMLMTKARVESQDKSILVPAGSFVYQKDEEKKLPAFCIDKYEVTNAEYGVFLDYVKKAGDHSFCHPDEPKNKDHTPQEWGKARAEKSNCPVVGVDWFDAYAYAKFVGKRLPTEEEWERAARGPSGRSFPWGNSKDDSEWVNSSNADGFAGIAPVDSLPTGESECGCCSMMGNAEEWTESWLKEESKSSRVVRGGHYNSPTTITVTSRGGYEPTTRTKCTGFRCANDAPAEKTPKKPK